MTSLFMGSLVNTGVPADEAVIRSTATPVDINAPAAMQDDMPEMEEVETDPNPNLGMVNRQLASKWHEPESSVPDWIPNVDASNQHNDIVNRQVSSSGFSAGQEAAGNWGHGTMGYAVGIEPVGDLREGGKMGNEYFKVNERPIQETAGNEMSVPPGYDHSALRSLSQTGKNNARDAATSAYDDYWNGGK